jgi:hypothetical protein
MRTRTVMATVKSRIKFDPNQRVSGSNPRIGVSNIRSSLLLRSECALPAVAAHRAAMSVIGISAELLSAP